MKDTEVNKQRGSRVAELGIPMTVTVMRLFICLAAREKAFRMRMLSDAIRGSVD